MKCRYCRTWNTEEEERCINCHRLLHLPLVHATVGTSGYIRGSAAPSWQPAEQVAAVPVPRPEMVPSTHTAPTPKRQQPIQGLLFGPTEMPQVISIDCVQPGKPKRRSKTTGAPSTARKSTRKKADNPDQAWLDFLAATPQPRGRQLDSLEEAVICCEAPVANRTLRILAASIDLGVIAILVAVFAASVYLSGASFQYGSRVGLGVLVAVPVLIGFFYKLLYCLADGESVGCQYTRIRLLSFEGRRPSRVQRVYRVAGAIVGILAGGLGLIWGLGDEESLTWHDHMSSTFPTAASLHAR